MSKYKISINEFNIKEKSENVIEFSDITIKEDKTEYYFSALVDFSPLNHSNEYTLTIISNNDYIFEKHKELISDHVSKYIEKILREIIKKWTKN